MSRQLHQSQTDCLFSNDLISPASNQIVLQEVIIQWLCFLEGIRDNYQPI